MSLFKMYVIHGNGWNNNNTFSELVEKSLCVGFRTVVMHKFHILY